ncbi:MAG: MotA/TolQ/ExbB proton channel family protein [Pirellulales bacterium]
MVLRDLRVRWAMFACLVLALLANSWAVAQQGPEPGAPLDEAARRAEEALNAPSDGPVPGDAALAPRETPAMNYFKLLWEGGPLMIPIGAMSILVLAYGVERGLALRRHKVIPETLVQELGDLAKTGGLEPRAAYAVCQRHPSPAAAVIRAALLKVGRPQVEVEAAVAQASDREAAKLFANVRTIMLGITVAPLLGLLGTVLGIIMAFYQMSSLPKEANRAEVLSEGIYIALVTTLAGLGVAIPAAILAHYYEGRIQNLFGEIEELLLNMLPQLERYEGKLRIRRAEKGTELDMEAAIPRGAEK